MVVKYNHCTYDDSGAGIKVDGSKDCNKATCEISPSGYKFDEDVLFNQYSTIMHKPKSFSKTDPEFVEVQKQVEEYLTTGTIPENSTLANYVKEWKE